MYLYGTNFTSKYWTMGLVYMAVTFVPVLPSFLLLVLCSFHVLRKSSIPINKPHIVAGSTFRSFSPQALPTMNASILFCIHGSEIQCHDIFILRIVPRLLRFFFSFNFIVS